MKSREKSENAIIPGCGLHHLAIKVHDFERSVAFYTQGLGFKEVIRWGSGQDQAIMLDMGDGCMFEVFAGGESGARPEGAILHVALQTSDCEAALKKALAAGAEPVMAPTHVDIPSTPQVTPVKIAFCKAPGGETLEFFQYD